MAAPKSALEIRVRPPSPSPPLPYAANASSSACTACRLAAYQVSVLHIRTVFVPHLGSSLPYLA
eukprot:123389-Rhodomonas_salina.3